MNKRFHANQRILSGLAFLFAIVLLLSSAAIAQLEPNPNYGDITVDVPVSNSVWFENFGGHITNNSTIDNSNLGTIINDGIDISGTWVYGTIDNFGTINNSGTIDNLSLFGGGTINNSGTFYNSFIFSGSNLDNTGDIYNSNLFSIGGIINTGTFYNSLWTINAGTTDNEALGTIDNSGLFDNEGTINNIGTIENWGIIKNYITLDDKVGTINNEGTIENWGEIKNSSRFDNKALGTINNSGTIENWGHSDTPTFNNDGQIYNSSTGDIDNYGIFDNYSTIENLGKINNLYAPGNFSRIFNNWDTGTIDNFGDIENQGTFNNDGTINNDGSIENLSTINNMGTIDNSGTIYNFGLIDNLSLIDNSGTIDNTAGTFNNQGVFKGTGTFIGTLDTGTGMVAPGSSAGTMSVIGDFILDGSGILDIEIGGFTPDSFDVLDITGTAFLPGGNINFSFLDGYDIVTDIGPLQSKELQFLNAGSIDSLFDPVFNYNFMSLPYFQFNVFKHDTGLVFEATNLVPLPGAVLLGGIGLAFASWKLRRRKEL